MLGVSGKSVKMWTCTSNLVDAAKSKNVFKLAEICSQALAYCRCLTHCHVWEDNRCVDWQSKFGKCPAGKNVSLNTLPRVLNICESLVVPTVHIARKGLCDLPFWVSERNTGQESASEHKRCPQIPVKLSITFLGSNNHTHLLMIRA